MRSPFPDLTIPDGSVFEYLFGDLGDDADRVVLVDGESGSSTTLNDLLAEDAPAPDVSLDPATHVAVIP